MTKLNIFPWQSSSILSATSLRSDQYPPHTPPHAPFSSPPSPLRRGCKADDLLWFSWTRRRHRSWGRKRKKERGKEDSLSSCHRRTLASFRTVFFPELRHSGHGRGGTRERSLVCHIVHILQLFRNTISFKWSLGVSMLPLFDLGNPWSNSLGITSMFKSYIWAIY